MTQTERKQLETAQRQLKRAYDNIEKAQSTNEDLEHSTNLFSKKYDLRHIISTMDTVIESN